MTELPGAAGEVWARDLPKQQALGALIARAGSAVRQHAYVSRCVQECATACFAFDCTYVHLHVKKHHRQSCRANAALQHAAMQRTSSDTVRRPRKNSQCLQDQCLELELALALQFDAQMVTQVNLLKQTVKRGDGAKNTSDADLFNMS